jgi:hydrogenase maturation protease
MNDRRSGRTIVLGLGNPLMGDDGIGLAALGRLRDQWSIGGDVELVDGGTWGLSLLPAIEDADRAIILDAIRSGSPVGSLVEIEREQLPRLFARALSAHQIGMQETLGLAELRGRLPSEIVAIGLEPGVVELRIELSPPVTAALDRLVRAAVARLEAWGHRCQPEATARA